MLATEDNLIFIKDLKIEIISKKNKIKQRYQRYEDIIIAVVLKFYFRCSLKNIQ